MSRDDTTTRRGESPPPDLDVAVVRAPVVIRSIELGRQIGVGGMAVVYEGLDKGFTPARRVAVKLMDPRLSADAGFRARFEREASLVAEFRHENIVHVYSSGEVDGAKYLVMEYLAGGTLAERMESGPLPVAEAISIGALLAEALSYSHARGVVHRDFKPSNVLITADGKPVLSDFGIAKPTLTAETALTKHPVVMGSARYMAPEQSLGRPVTDRADLYSFGMTMFEMLTGRQPELPEGVLRDLKHGGAIHALLVPISPILGDLICRCLLFDPEARPTAQECARVLRSLWMGAAGPAAARQHLRIFVSSPSDVIAAREVAVQIIEKLAQEHARFFTLEPYLWDYERMLASGQFEDVADPPSRFEAVILILASRLGALLPERTARREYRGIGGRAPLPGTEWAFEEALIATRERGVPELLVYRSQGNVEVSTRDAQSRQLQLKQLEALDAFWARYAQDTTAAGGKYAQFRSLEEFTDRFERDLRSCVEGWIKELSPVERAATVRLWAKAPFRGLESYEFEHAQIFFGRDEVIGAALLRLIANARAGRPFLLVLGASGSGKSSFVKAGMVPRLLGPQRVPGVAFLRRVVFRPSDVLAREDLFDALARRLTEREAEGTGVPELLGTSMLVQEFAGHLREASRHPHMPLAMVLDQLAELARSEGRMLRYEQGMLLLVIDQLEELFTGERVPPEERGRFVQLLVGLVRSGRVWVIATMRADFWHRAAETPDLIRLADSEGRLDLLPPTPSEVSRMIRGPAEAAAIHFETHASSGIPLNDVIAEAAAGEPGVLPLLSYLLDQLYQRDIKETGGDTLTYASYEAFGGLKGAIATRAEAVLERCAPEDRQALGSVLFSLVEIGAAESNVERAIARRVPLSTFPACSPQRRLVEALLDPGARLLVSDTEKGGSPTVRVAHEALISRWTQARDFVQSNAEALKIRHRIEERYAVWRGLKEGGLEPTQHETAPSPSSIARLAAWRSRFGREHGLLSDIDLADGRRLLKERRTDTEPHLVAYIERSIADNKRIRTRTVRVLAVVASVVTLLAIVASGAGWIASQRQHEAQYQATQALQAQARLLTEAAAQRMKDSDVAGAQGIILEVLTNPRFAQGHTPAALSVFQEIRAADAQLAVLSGHGDRVFSAAYSPDGTRIVTASEDKTTRVWDARTGEQLAVLSGHSARVNSAAYSPDGAHITTASLDKTARIWDARTGEQLGVLSGHGDRVNSAAYSPDGSRIVTASDDKTARVWDARTGAQLTVLSGHGAFVESAAYSPDGTHIVTASDDKTARIWHTRSDSELAVFSGHGDGVNSAGYSPDGTRIVTASFDKTARVWDARTGIVLTVFFSHGARVSSLAYSPDGTHIIAALNDKTARIWDAHTGFELGVLSGHDAFASAVYSPDGTRIVTASLDKTARVWDARTGAEITVLSGHGAFVASASYSPDGNRIVTASEDKTARVWDARTGAQLNVLSGHAAFVASATYSPDDTRIVTASKDHTARIWDAHTGRELTVLSGHDGILTAATYSPDGTRIVTASFDKTARIWDARTGIQLAVLLGHGGIVYSAAYSPDGSRIVTASDDKTVRIWDARVSGDISAQIAWYASAYPDSLSDLDRTRLGLLSDSRATIWPARGSACDKAAAAFYDPDRLAPGVAQSNVNGDIARSACFQKTANAGTTSRLAYERGRALLGKSDVQGARQQFELAVSEGYRAARVDLANLLVDPSAGMLAPERAVSLYQKAWQEGVPIAAFELGHLYEVGFSGSHAAAPGRLESDLAKAWSWHKKGADVGEPNALARFAERDERNAMAETEPQKRNALLLRAFSHYAAACERAHDEDWRDDAWRHWRYRRATLARLLAREGRMQQVADAYQKEREKWSPQAPTMWETIEGKLHL